MRTISSFQLSLLCSLLSSLLKAGLNEAEALAASADQMRHPRVRTAIKRLAIDLAAGKTLSQAVTAQGRLFPREFALVVAAGEESGKLAEALREYREVLRFNRKVVVQLRPLCVLPLAWLVLFSFYSFVKKNILFFDLDFYETGPDPGKAENFLEFAFITLSLLTFQYTELILLFAAAGFGLGVLFLAWPSGRNILEVVVANFSVTRPYLLSWQLNRFFSHVRLFLSSGHTLSQAFEKGVPLVGSPFLRGKLQAVNHSLSRGNSLLWAVTRQGLGFGAWAPFLSIEKPEEAMQSLQELYFEGKWKSLHMLLQNAMKVTICFFIAFVFFFLMGSILYLIKGILLVLA